MIHILCFLFWSSMCFSGFHVLFYHKIILKYHMLYVLFFFWGFVFWISLLLCGPIITKWNSPHLSSFIIRTKIQYHFLARSKYLKIKDNILWPKKKFLKSTIFLMNQNWKWLRAWCLKTICPHVHSSIVVRTSNILF